jgi:hypothetical protein
MEELVLIENRRNPRHLRPHFRMEAMARHRTHSAEFKRQSVQEFLAGETLHGLATQREPLVRFVRSPLSVASGVQNDSATRP